MFTFWDNFFYSIEHEGLIRIINLFWYYFYIEAPRFVILDVIILGIILFQSRRNKLNFKRARYELLAENPLVSIIVPGRNEGQHIFKLVNGLREQTYTNLEFIIVDDASDDDTYLICRDLKENGPAQYRTHEDSLAKNHLSSVSGPRLRQAPLSACFFIKNARSRITARAGKAEQANAVDSNVQFRAGPGRLTSPHDGRPA